MSLMNFRNPILRRKEAQEYMKLMQNQCATPTPVIEETVSAPDIIIPVRENAVTPNPMLTKLLPGDNEQAMDTKGFQFPKYSVKLQKLDNL